MCRSIRCSFSFLFFDESNVSKQNSPRSESAFCGVTFGAILFVYVPYKDAILIWIKATRSVSRQRFKAKQRIA